MIDASTETSSPQPTDTSAVDSLLAQAIDAHQALDFVGAEAAYRTVLEHEPEHADASHNLGVLLAVQLLRPQEALPYFEAALNADAERPQFWFSYIDCLVRCEHFDLARQVLPLAQGLSVGMVNALTERMPRVADTSTHIAIPEPEQEPNQTEKQALVSLFQQKKYEQGEAHARKLVQRYPESGFAWKALGTMLQPQGKKEEALEAKKRAVQLLPDDAEGLCNLGRSYFELGLTLQAIEALRICVATKPDYAEALNNLGLALNANGQVDEARQCFERAIKIQPQFAEALNNLSGLFTLNGQIDEAIAVLRKAVAAKSDYKIAFDNLLFVVNYHPEYSAEEIFKSYCEYERRFGAPARADWAPHHNLRSTQRRLKVGYVSPDFRGHACTYFMEPLLARHDRQVVELYAYAELTHEDAVTQRYKQYVEHWVPTRGMSDVALAQRIRADGIDILVDLAGHTAGNRLGAFARKPAPVSVSWMGFGYTTGLRAIDYYLTDAICTPAGSEHLFSEEPWRLDGTCFTAYRPGPGMGEVNALPAVERGYITLGTLTRGVRINHHSLRVWATILQRLPTAHLVIDSRSFQDTTVQADAVQKFAAHGIAAERLHIGFNSPPWDVLRGIDIGLDCFPHNSGTTLFETLYMGIPYVTLAGRPSVGRIGSSILHSLGHPEWIAHSEGEYIEKVVALASDLPALAQHRASLRAEMHASVLMDERGFTRKVEQAYAQMFARWASTAPKLVQKTASMTRRSEPSADEMKLVASFFQSRDFAAGEVAARELVRLYPEHGFGWKALGTMLHPLGRAEEALHAKKQAAQLMPQDAEAACNLGQSLQDIGQYALAETVLKRALALKPDYAEAYNNLAITYQKMGRVPESEANFQAALALNPNSIWIFDNLLFTLNYHPDHSAEQIFKSYCEYERRFGDPYRSDWKPHANERTPGRRLKVGYVSPDFRSHACSYFLEPLLAGHDPALVEVTAYADLSIEDAASQRYKGYVSHWVPTRAMSDAALAQRIRADGIDILVDLAGHSTGNRLGAFARKPAPVSMSWMGYGYTTGLRAIDYYLTDAICTPAGSEHLFSEEPWRLDGTCFTAYRPGPGMGEVNALPAVERGYITLGTLTRGVRINHHSLRVWATILQRLPTAHLVIDSRSFQDTTVQADAVQKFAAHGIAAERLHIGFNSPPWDVLRGIDIGLDCFPHNSGTTLFETLYMGIPYVTLAGRPSVGRIGSSILHSLGHPEWIAHSEGEYIEKVVALASDLPALAQHRASLRAEMHASVLMDERGFTRKVEQAYAQMFARWARQTAVDAVEAAPAVGEMNALVRLFQDQAFAQGEAAAQALVARYPRHGYSWKLLGSFLQKQGHVEAALQAKQRAVQLLPDDTEALFNLALAYEQQGLMAQAEPCYRAVIAQHPDDADAHHNLGNTLVGQGKQVQAIPCYREALRLQPQLESGYDSLGGLLQDAGFLVEAESVWRRFLQVKPGHMPAVIQLGRNLQRQGRRAEAEACMRSAVDVKEDDLADYFTRANLLGELGLYADAEADFRRALEINPKAPEIWCNLAANLKEQGRLTEAEACALRALDIQPELVVAVTNHAVILMTQGRLVEAEAGFRQALELMPDNQGIFSNMLFALNYDADKSAEEIFEAYREFDRRFCSIHRDTWAPHTNAPAAGRRLKVGYVSPDFKNHSCIFFMEPLLSQHDAQVVELYAYADLTQEDHATKRYKEYFEHWVPIRGVSDAALAQRIRADGIDILVDMAGHTSGNRLCLFARKPAPVSMSWMGYGYTTGLQAIDYYLTDAISAPKGSEHLFAETPWPLPDTCFTAYRPGTSMGEVNALPALQRGYVTLGTLTRGVRINYRTIRVWVQILRRLPTARIVIDSSSFKDHDVAQALLQQFTAQGIAQDRVYVGYNSPPWDVLRGIDIGLDCFPHNSGTTLVETLYMGIPYATLAGRPSVGRIGSSILHGVGHPEWIAQTEDEYVEIVVALANDLPALAAHRAHLRGEMQASTLMDEPGFARKVEAAYAQMFQRWEESQK
ncbi:beta-barrel assembly-enhancing protease [Comamonadaceae bacterium OS-1]|nr:beta-barrel assembly-enhancing protease [Comamonadaceae bacterium OS-1]